MVLLINNNRPIICKSGKNSGNAAGRKRRTNYMSHAPMFFKYYAILPRAPQATFKYSIVKCPGIDRYMQRALIQLPWFHGELALY